MVMRDRTVAFICLLLTAIIWSTPITYFDTEFEGVDNDRMEWSCPRPITSPLPGAVDYTETLQVAQTTTLTVNFTKTNTKLKLPTNNIDNKTN